MIAAIGRNRELGGKVNGKSDLLWHIPEDFKHFKSTTLGKPVIMGSKTFESIGKALPKRLNIVLSHKDNYMAEGCEVVHSLEDALSLTIKDVEGSLDIDEVFIIGGGFVYKQALEQKIVDRLYITIIDADFAKADVFFPDYTEYGFVKVVEERESNNKEFKYTFTILEKIC